MRLLGPGKILGMDLLEHSVLSFFGYEISSSFATFYSCYSFGGGYFSYKFSGSWVFVSFSFKTSWVLFCY